MAKKISWTTPPARGQALFLAFWNNSFGDSPPRGVADIFSCIQRDDFGDSPPPLPVFRHFSCLREESFLGQPLQGVQTFFLAFNENIFGTPPPPWAIAIFLALVKNLLGRAPQGVA